MLVKRLTIVIATLALALPALAWAAAGRAAPAAGDWWDPRWTFRVAVEVAAGGAARRDKTADVALNFTELLTAAGEDSRFNPASIRVVEVDGGGAVIDAAVPFQFDRATDYDPNENAAGTLTILLTGPTGADETRRYHVYFDVVGAFFEEPDFPARVAVSTITDLYGYETFRVANRDGVYHYHRTGGGFASLFDADEQDWISWNPAARGAGDFRGIPNMVHPADGGYFHPGRTSVDSAISRRGPLKVTIRSTSSDGLWITQWEITPDAAKLTVLKYPAAKRYWLLYEGTPGGKLDLATDTVTRPDGTTTTAGESWSGDLPGAEWVYFSDPALGRSLFAAHHEQDEIVDSYTPDELGQMTIFGFGRSGNSRFLQSAGPAMTIGLVDATEPAAVEAAIRAAYAPLGITVGAPEVSPVTPTPSPSPTDEPTATPRPTRTPTPTDTPEPTPTATNTPTMTATATSSPTATATTAPSATPTTRPTRGPSPTPTREPEVVWHLPYVAAP